MRRVGFVVARGGEGRGGKSCATTRHGCRRGAARRWRGTPGGVPIGVCQPLGVCPGVPRDRQRGVVLCSSSTAFAGDRRSTRSGGGHRGGCLGSRADPSGECLDSVAGVSSTALSLSLTRSLAHSLALSLSLSSRADWAEPTCFTRQRRIGPHRSDRYLINSFNTVQMSACSIVARSSAIRSIASVSAKANATAKAFARAPQASMAAAPATRAFGSSAVRNAKRTVNVSVNAASNGTEIDERS